MCPNSQRVGGARSTPHQHEPWRYTFLSGLIPAIPLILIRPFLPESPVWAEKRAAGTLRRPTPLTLLAPAFRRTTLVTTLMFACSYGVAFGAIQQIPEIVPGLANVKEKTAGQPPPKQREIEQKTAADYTKVQEIGGLVGRFLLAFLAVRIVSRQRLIRLFLVPSLIVVPLVFYFFLTVPNHEIATLDLSSLRLGTLPITTVSLGVFVAGLLTVAQFSFWGDYSAPSLSRAPPWHRRKRRGEYRRTHDRHRVRGGHQLFCGSRRSDTREIRTDVSNRRRQCDFRRLDCVVFPAGARP